ncbi:MAG: hypothetical protein ACUZ8E_17785 [Candidatus Anammoxibacter sp.]
MRFLFVDRILELEKGKCATGIKNVSFSDEYLVSIVPNFPVMPRSLTMESIAQLISWLVIISKDFTVKPIAVMTENIKWRGYAIPGDQLLIRAEIKSMHENDALCNGTIEVDGKIITELKNGVCAFIPLEELEDVSTVKEKAILLTGNRNLEEFVDKTRTGSDKLQTFNNDNCFDLNLVDKILDMEIGQHIQGVKSLTMTEEFIVDHFPKRHVMPGTMIIESFTHLSEKLLQETIKAKTGQHIKVLIKESNKVKFRNYVKPGDQVLLDINLINLTDNTATVKAKATVNKKLVTSAQIEFDIIHLSK